MAGLFDFLTQAREAGRGARAGLEDSITYYIPPELRGLLGLAAEANPVVSMERAGQDAQRLVQPGLSGWDRMAAAGDMASNMAGVLAPMAAGRAAGMPAVRAAQEGLLGLSMTPEAAALRQFGGDEFGGVPVSGPVRTQKVGNTTVQFSIADDGAAEIYSVRTPKDKRGGGSARAAMDAILPQLRDEGATSVKLVSSPLDAKTNPARLKGFYESLGFRGTGETANIAGDPVMRMDFPQSTDAAAQQGSEIINLLRSGRAGEVTEQMLDMGDPVLNARLSEYLYSNYDLPMDAASRMGRAEGMGADLARPLFRGDANPDLSQFNTGQYAREGIGVTSSTSPNVAATYMAGDRPAMYPLLSTPSRQLNIDVGGRSWTGISPDAPANDTTLANVLPPQSFLDEENLFDFLNGRTVDWGDGTDTALAVANTNDVSRAAQAQGFDEVMFNNIVDRGGAARFHSGPANDPQTTVMTSDPRNIRSRFARFDPRLSHLRNLNAAITAGVPLGLLAMQPGQEPQ